MALRWTISVLVAVCGCTRAVTPIDVVHGAPTAHYAVTIFDNFDGAKVRACFEGFPVRRLAPINDSGESSLSRALTEQGELRVRGGVIDIPSAPNRLCVDYETRFSDEVYRTRDGRAVVVSQSQWLWRPGPFPDALEASAVLSLNDGARAAVPFAREGSGYALDRDTFFRDGYNVFGFFAEERFELGKTEATIVRLGPNPGAESARRWLESAMVASASVGDEFPSPRVLFVVVPIDGGERPVQFGMIRRGGGASVILLPSSAAGVETLEADWVAIHELSHLWLPRLYGTDRWLTEGVATYLQEVLRTRCGLQSADVSWARIADGLERGRRAGTGRTLTRESRDMNRTGAYHRVYWAGAAFALEVDVRLRRRSNGEMSLLRALAMARPELLGRTGLTTANEVLAALDRAAGSDFLVELGSQYASSSRFPSSRWLRDPKMEAERLNIMTTDSQACRLIDESPR